MNKIQVANFWKNAFPKIFASVAGASLLLTSMAQAQVLLEEIEVTARKTSENLQDVPLSITAISAGDLEEASVYQLEDLAEITPGLTYQSVGSFGQPTIRGLAQTNQGGLQGNVGVFLDGVFLNNRSALEFGVLDLARIEVVKGPQGALYGRNTFAGAINYVTEAPSTEAFSGRVSGEIGSDDRREIGGSLNIPLGENAALRLFGATSEFDGTIRNARGGQNLGGFDKRASFGASLLFTPTDELAVKIFAVRNEIEEDQPPLNLVPFNNNNCGSFYTDPPGDFASLYCGGLLPGQETSLSPIGIGQNGDFTLAYVNVDYELPFATLTANFNHSKSDYSAFVDNTANRAQENVPLFPGTPFSAYFFTNSNGDVAEQDSFELRLASDQNAKLRWLAGASWFDTLTGTVLSSASTLLDDPSTLERITFVATRLQTDIKAIFGSISYAFNDQHRASLEVRRTEEDQDQTGIRQIFFIPNFPNSSVTESTDFSYTTPRFTYEFTQSADTLIYGSAAKGVKTGGINAGFVGTPFFTFDEESNWTYELGLKTSILGGRGVFNATAYFIDWEDLQIPAPASLQAGTAIVNAAGATSKGIELDTTINITDNFTFRGALTYLQPEFDGGVIDSAVEGICGVTAAIPPVSNCSANVGGNQLPRTSDVQVYLGGTYTMPDIFRDFDGYVRLDASHQAGKYSTSLNLIDQGDINLVNLRLGLQSERYEVSLWVQNLLDEDYLARITPQTDPSALALCPGCALTRGTIFPANGRNFGLRATVNF